MIIIIIFLIVILGAAFFYWKSQQKRSLHLLKSRHIFITGGSKGIGFELAKLAVKNGAHVTIVARNLDDLEKAKLDLIKMSNAACQNILAYSADVCESLFNMERAVTEAESHSGPIFLLACCAGTAIARTFSDSSTEDFHKMMNINYFGSVNTIKSVLPSLRKHPHGAHLLLFSSLGGIFGLYGYSAYAASKFALVGLAEVLAMELRPDRIGVTVSFPPDTDTPGFEQEQLDKPEITKLISEEGGLFTPHTVAYQALCDTLHGEFISTVGLNGYVLTTLCAGMMPTKSWPLRIFQVCTMGILRIVGLHFLYTCDKIISAKSLKADSSKEKGD